MTTKNSIFGDNASVSRSSIRDSVVLGHDAVCRDSNTVQLGNTSMKKVNTTGDYVTSRDVIAKKGTIQGNALKIGTGTSVFNSEVNINDNLTVTGQLQGIDVSFTNLDISNNLTVDGNVNINGQLHANLYDVSMTHLQTMNVADQQLKLNKGGDIDTLTHVSSPGGIVFDTNDTTNESYIKFDTCGNLMVKTLNDQSIQLMNYVDISGHLQGNDVSFANLDISNDLTVTGAITGTTLAVTGATTLTGALDANSTADIADTLTLSKASGTGLSVTANATVGGTLGVTGATTLTGALDANSTADIADTLTLSKASGTGLSVTADATVSGTLAVTGATTLTGALDANSTADIADTLTLSKASGTGLSVTADATVSGTLAVTGATTLTGALDANSTADIADTLTLSKASGTGLSVTADATVSGTLAVTGDTTLTGALNANGGVTGALTGNADTATKIASITNTNIVQLTDTQTLSNKTLTSPTITGTGAIAGTFTGDVSGNVTGNADTATKIASITNSDIVQLTDTQTLSNKTLTSPTITGTGAIAGTFTGDVSGNVTGNADTATKIASITNTNIVQLTDTQTLSNKTLTSPTITGTGAIAGTFTGDVSGNVTGNADTATKIASITNTNIVQLTDTQTLSNKTLTNCTFPTLNQDTTGSAATLTTARTIGGVSFNGSGAIDLPGVNTAGNQDTAGNAATVTNGVYTNADNTFTGTTNTFNSIPVLPESDPTSDNQAARKAYVDSVAQGLKVKDSCIAATTANVTLSGTQTIDGKELAADDRVLVKDQNTASDNGIYVVAAGASWYRSTDLEAGTNAASAFVFVESGTVNADSGWVCTTDTGSAVTGTNNLSFAQFSGAGQVTAGSGMTKSGNTLNVIGGNGITANADNIVIDTSVVVDKSSNQSIGGTKTFTSNIAATGGVTGALSGNVSGNVAGNLTGSVLTATQNSITTMTGLTAAGATGVNTTFSGPIVASEGVTGALSGNVAGNVTGNLTGSVLTATQNSITTMTGLTAAGTSGANTTFSGPIVASEGVTGDVTGDITGNAVTVTNGVYTTGAQNIAGAKTFSTDLTVEGNITASGTVSTDNVMFNPYWFQMGQDIDGDVTNKEFGHSVSLSSDGTIMAIGTPKSNHVRIYQNSASTWTQLGNDIDGEAENDYSGQSVSLSSDGTIVAIGASDNSNSQNWSGHVRIYQYSNSSWSQLGQDIDGEAGNDYSGWSVSLSSDGTIVAIGALYNDGNGNDSGHVRIYQYSNSSSSWSQLGGDIDGEAAGDYSGYAVSLSSDGTIVAIGATSNSNSQNSSGHVRIYQYSNSSWSQLGGDIDGEAAYDYSGWSVSLSSDGTIVAIGAIKNDGTGTDSGHVRIYQYSSSSWSQLGQDIDGEAAGDQSGYSVSLSSDGTIVAIGAIKNDGNGTNSGHVRVYSSLETSVRTNLIDLHQTKAHKTNPTITGLLTGENATFSGTLTGISATEGTNTTQLATTAFVNSTIKKLSDNFVNVSSSYAGNTEDGKVYSPYKTITAAISGSSDGDTIFIYSGTYSETIILPTDKSLSFVGQDKEKTILKSASGLSESCFYQSDSSSTQTYKWKNLTIQDSLYGIRSKGATEYSVENCLFKNNGWDGTAASAETQAGYVALWASNNTSNGGALRIENASLKTRVVGCEAKYNLRGLRVQQCSNVIVQDNHTHHNLESGIYLAVGPTVVENSLITGNKVEYNKNNGILLVGSLKVQIMNNSVTNNYNSGIQMWYAGEIDITNNVINYNSLKTYNGIGNAGDSYGGIALSGMNTTYFSSSVVSYYCNINGNSIMNNEQGGQSSKYAIYIATNVTGTGSNVYASGNEVVGEDDMFNSTTVVAELNTYVLNVALDDISTASSCFVVAPKAGTITKITSIIDGTTATDDAVITANVNGGTNISEQITIASGSAAATIDDCSPSDNNTVTVGQYIKLTTDGASTNTVKAVFTIEITY